MSGKVFVAGEKVTPEYMAYVVYFTLGLTLCVDLRNLPG
jgi:hypothetical protein